MIITIDGSAGSGKSTVARRLADALGFDLLNTGGMYRAVAVALARLNIDIYADKRDVAGITSVVDTLTFDMPPGRVLLNGMDFTAEVRTEDAGRGASKVGTFPEVRARLKREQRRIADGRNVVCEGRDQGTAVFPDAPVKFFLFATPDVRADRRVEQLQGMRIPADRAAILEQIVARDKQDETRPIDPLKAAPDAVRLDTTEMSTDDVLAVMLEVVAKCRSRR